MAQAGSRRIALAGLERPVEIRIDRWGVPHIYAATIGDAFLAQGWNVARDRLWQLDLWRKRGLGRLAESFGPAYVEQDRAARLFLYRGDMDAEWSVYGPNAKPWTEAFVAGLNAYVRRVLAGAAPLPVEFTLTDSRPEFWSADDVVRIRSHGISNNAESETLRVRVAGAGGLEADRIRRKLDPDHALRVPDGLNPAEVPADILAVYTLATREVSFAGEAPPSPAEAEHVAATQGSNNWAIAGSRTASGRPILASDPHRVLVAPSIRYLVHLDAPGLKVMGAGEPHLPGITIGHNERCAFGITTFMVDQADLYVYELNPDDPGQYRYGDGWEDLRIVRETLAVKGEAPREVGLAYTRHGPVLKLTPEQGRAFALRTVWTEPGTAAYFGAARYQTAASWREFRDALKHWRAAPMNFVYADVAGDIGWSPAGLMPRRRTWDGLMGAPGDGRYEWDGFATQEELPALHNPGRGWVASANEMNIPKGHPAHALNLGFEWADPVRAQRIAEVLDANPAMTVEASARLQCDVTSLAALRGVRLLAGLRSPDPDVRRALGLLAGWDGVESVGSAAAAIAEVWLSKHLVPATARRITTEAAARIIGFGSPYAVTTYLAAAECALDPAAREAVLLESLASALAELRERLGPDMAAWTWGALHHARFTPAASALADPALRAKMAHGPVAMPGSAFTLCAHTYRMEDFALTNGPSFRMVCDVGDWDGSLIVNSPGQSGDPESPHYADLFPLWARGDYVPMLWTRGAVEAATEQVIELTP